MSVVSLAWASLAPGQESSRPPARDDPRYGLLSPIPETGGIPPIIELLNAPSEEQLGFRARVREYETQIRIIAHKHFGSLRVESRRAEGIELLREFTDPAAFRPMIQELEDEQDDVRLAVLDHFLAQGDEGQAALAWLAIHDDDDAMRAEAINRLTAPASEPVLRVLDASLRSPVHETANNAGTVAGAVHALRTIPLLIFGQATRDPVPENTGDLAWISFETQHPFIADSQTVVGGGVGAFQPVIGLIHEGVVLRVMDAVVISYRTEIHRSLVTMTSLDWGWPTDDLGYDMRAWWEWYNTEYLPFKNEQIELAALAEPENEIKSDPPGDSNPDPQN